jgi:hypothetical protein
MVLEIKLTLQGCRLPRDLQSCNLPLKMSLCYFCESNANALLPKTKDALRSTRFIL